MSDTPFDNPYGLTDAETVVANERASASGRPLEEVAAEVKAERVGPAALVERDDVPEPNVPGGTTAPANINAEAGRVDRLVEQARQIAAELASIGGPTVTIGPATQSASVSHASVTDQSLPNVPAALTPTGTPTGTATVATWDDERIRSSSAADLVGYVQDNPAEAERVRAIEEERDKPRSTVLDATEAAG